jgi:hypothetical protein
MKLFESCSTRHQNLSSSPLRRQYLTHEVTIPLLWKSQALLCKDPLMGYMNATHLPKELIELILLYVGVFDLHKTGGSYREMNMNSMRKLLDKEKKGNWDQFLGAGKIFFTSFFYQSNEAILVGMILLAILASFASLNTKVY